MTAGRYDGRARGPEPTIRALAAGREGAERLRARAGNRLSWLDARVFDYDHLLDEDDRANDCSLRVYQNGDRFQACLGHRGEQIGHWRGELFGRTLVVGNALLDEEYRDNRLGRQMLLALLVHAAHAGALVVEGGIHSTSAHRAHASLAREYGLDYEGLFRRGMEALEEKPNDSRYNTYSYALDPVTRTRK